MADKRLDTVVFDVGNVLVDFRREYLYRKIFSDTSEMQYFLDNVATWEWHLEQDRGRTMAEATELLVSQHPERRKEIEAYYDRWDEMFGGPIDGTVGILHELEDAGVTLHALTNWSAELFGRAQETFPYLNTFEVTVVSGEVELLKPDPEIYEVLIERTGLDPRTSAFIDDSRPNVDTANDLGFTGIRFTDPQALRKSLHDLGLVRETGSVR